MNIKDTLTQNFELEKTQKNESKSYYDIIMIHKLIKLMLIGNHHQFTKLFLSKDFNVLTELNFQELYNNMDSESRKEYASDAYGCLVKTNLPKVAIQTQDDLFQSIIFSKINAKELFQEAEYMENHHNFFEYIFYTDDRKSFINLLENLKENDSLCYEKTITFMVKKILFDQFDLSNKELSEHKKSFFDWLINLKITEQALNNNLSLLINNENFLCTHNDYALKVIDKIDKKVFNEQFKVIFNKYAENERFHPHYSQRDISHNLFPYLLKNNYIDNIDEKMENFLKRRYHISLGRLRKEERDKFPGDLEMPTKTTLKP